MFLAVNLATAPNSYANHQRDRQESEDDGNDPVHIQSLQGKPVLQRILGIDKELMVACDESGGRNFGNDGRKVTDATFFYDPCFELSVDDALDKK